MKRTTKITITRQTLRTLGTDHTRQVVGGFSHNCTGDTDESHGPTCGRGTICHTRFC